MNEYLRMFFFLMCGHVIADHPLQGQYLAIMKSRKLNSPEFPWQIALGSHALIHGFFVAVFTGIWWLGILEALLHALIDDSKCTGKINIWQDQSLHVLCKVLWLIIYWVVK